MPLLFQSLHVRATKGVACLKPHPARLEPSALQVSKQPGHVAEESADLAPHQVRDGRRCTLVGDMKQLRRRRSNRPTARLPDARNAARAGGAHSVLLRRASSLLPRNRPRPWPGCSAGVTSSSTLLTTSETGAKSRCMLVGSFSYSEDLIARHAERRAAHDHAQAARGRASRHDERAAKSSSRRRCCIDVDRASRFVVDDDRAAQLLAELFERMRATESTGPPR